jgi:hypothetical protein
MLEWRPPREFVVTPFTWWRYVGWVLIALFLQRNLRICGIILPAGRRRRREDNTEGIPCVLCRWRPNPGSGMRSGAALDDGVTLMVSLWLSRALR